MGIHALKRAVFLDRDGVLNLNVLNPATGQNESPHHPDDFHLFPDTISSLKRLQAADYLLFVVSNQPSYAKGKTSLENIHATAEKLYRTMEAESIMFTKYYYCYHHPDGIIPAFSGPCPCRKPSPFFLKEAEKNFGVNLKASWMVGDRDVDIICGNSVGARTILISSDPEHGKTFPVAPDYSKPSLTEAVDIILSA